MTHRAFKVFVVDDDPVARMLNALSLQASTVEVAEFADGDACLAAVAAGITPDIVILDVEMPGTDGIATCRALRMSGQLDAEIVFVSAHDDLATRLAAYDAGGNDYIVKPYGEEELARSIEVAERAIRARHEVAEHVRRARHEAATDLPAPGDVGVLAAFLREASSCRTADELGLAFCSALKQYGLHGLIDLHDAQKAHCYSSQGRLTALEASILDHLRGMERVFQFHDRLVIRYPHVTLLIPNLLPDDHEQANRLQNHLSILVGGTEAYFRALPGETPP